MATDLRCPNCGDNLGKDKENPKNAWCGTCGSKVKNPYGYNEDQAGNDIGTDSENRSRC